MKLNQVSDFLHNPVQNIIQPVFDYMIRAWIAHDKNKLNIFFWWLRVWWLNFYKQLYFSKYFFVLMVFPHRYILRA